MATYEVTLEDGRKRRVDSDSSDEARIKKQANHQEFTTALIAERRGHQKEHDPSLAVKVEPVSEDQLARERVERRRLALGE